MQLIKNNKIINFPMAWENIGNPTLEIMEEKGWSVYMPPKAIIATLPIIVSPRQIRQALTIAGMRDAVEAGVAAGDINTKDWWEFATQFEENHPQIVAMCAALGITEEQTHQVFVIAQGL